MVFDDRYGIRGLADIWYERQSYVRSEIAAVNDSNVLSVLTDSIPAADR